MLTRTRDTQIDKAKRTMRDMVEYAQEVARDERLRADVRAALAHGSKAGDQLKKEIQAGGTYSTLAANKKLRKNLRAMLNDLDDAGNRMRRGRRHRARNAVLVVTGAVAAALAFPRVRPWLEEQASDIVGTGSAEPEPLT